MVGDDGKYLPLEEVPQMAYSPVSGTEFTIISSVSLLCWRKFTREKRQRLPCIVEPLFGGRTHAKIGGVAD